MGSSKSQIAIWAAILFLGFNVLGMLISWLLPEAVWDSGSGSDLPWEGPRAFSVIPFALLLVSYFFVRRLSNQMLSRLWLYTIIAVTIGLVSASVVASVGSASTLGWWLTAFGLAGLIVLVWFARKMSAMSFRHASLFIVLTMAVPNATSITPSESHMDPSLPMYVTLWVGGVLIDGLAVWMLANSRAIVSTTRTLLLPVIAMLLLIVILVGLSTIDLVEPDSVLDLVVPMLTAGLSSLMLPLLAVSVTYAVRVRGGTGSGLGC